jgi:casein kinase II subunit alpha
LIYVLIRQLSVFEPLPTSYGMLIAENDSSRWDVLENTTQYIEENNMVMPFALAVDECLTEEDKKFILKIMKIDPRDRPTAMELLADKWFDGVP